ncbi:MAG: hypothetical protein M3P39_11505 [Actinomycetota bacterium]|nr:hypothetical protein [Actinomycetota bacterium]
MAVDEQERDPQGDEVTVGDATQGAGVEPEPGEGTEGRPAPTAGSGDEAGGALAADDETGAGISARDADREEADSA